MLIAVCMDQDNKTIDDCIEWFKKAISLQFDYYPAYREISGAISHKLEHNNELLYDFAASCLRCEDNCTAVPEYAFKMLLNMAGQIDDYRWQILFLQPQIYQELIQWINKKERDAKSVNAKNQALTIQALINIYTLNYKKANMIIKSLGPGVFDREITKLDKTITSPVISWNNPQKLAEMFSGKYGKELGEIQKKFLAGGKAEAMRSLSEIIEKREEELSKQEKLFMIDLLARIGIAQKASLYKDLGSSPLNVGLYYRTDPDFIKRLLKLGIDCSVTTPYDKRTALMIAAQRSPYPKLADALNKAGIDLNLKDKYRWTALEHSIFMNNLPFTKRLIELVADVNTIDDTDNPLLLKVLLWKKYKVFDMLLLAGANIDICVSRNRTLLMRALSQNLDPEGLKKLLQHNINLEEQSDQNWTAIYYAICYYHNSDALKLLLKKGAEVNTSDRDGNTPLIIAVLWAKNPEKIKLLLNHGANINEKNRAGKTPLIMAVISQNSLEYVKILVENGAILNETDNNKYTAYDWAVKNKKDAVAQFEHGDSLIGITLRLWRRSQDSNPLISSRHNQILGFKYYNFFI